MNLLILLAIGLFTGFLLLFLLLLPRSSEGEVLLEEVKQQARAREGAVAARTSHINTDALAKPFTLVRGLFSSAPNPGLVRRLTLAGYRKPAHADIFLGVKLVLPAILGFSAAFIFQDNVIVCVLIAERFS